MRGGPALAPSQRQDIARHGAWRIAFDEPCTQAVQQGLAFSVLQPVAMVMAGAPKIILLDEPMAGMGRGESAVMTKTIREMRQQCGVLLVEHDMDVVFALADTITVLVKGEVIASGTPDAIRADADVQAAYLGND